MGDILNTMLDHILDYFKDEQEDSFDVKKKKFMICCFICAVLLAVGGIIYYIVSNSSENDSGNETSVTTKENSKSNVQAGTGENSINIIMGNHGVVNLLPTPTEAETIVALSPTPEPTSTPTPEPTPAPTSRPTSAPAISNSTSTNSTNSLLQSPITMGQLCLGFIITVVLLAVVAFVAILLKALYEKRHAIVKFLGCALLALAAIGGLYFWGKNIDIDSDTDYNRVNHDRTETVTVYETEDDEFDIYNKKSRYYDPDYKSEFFDRYADSSNPITEEELYENNFSYNHIQYFINEMLARYGYYFGRDKSTGDEDTTDVFESKSWFKEVTGLDSVDRINPRTEDIIKENFFNETETQTWDILKKYRDQKKAEKEQKS